MAKSRSQILGTEGAVIFGDEASSSLGQNLSYLEAIEQRRRQQAQQQAQERARSWRDNMLKADNNTLWRDEIGASEQAHITQGIELMNQGIDPYTSLDPRAQQYRSDRQRIMDMRNVRAQRETEWNDLNKAIRKDGPDVYRPEDIQALQDYVGGSFSDIYENNTPIPSLRKRFSVTDALKGVRPVVQNTEVTEGNVRRTTQGVDVPATERVVLANLSRTPEGQEYLSTISMGVPIPELRNAPSTLDETKELVEGIYDSEPSIREQLAANGIVSKSDPRFQEYVDSEAQRRLNAKRNFDRELGTMVESISGGITTRDTSRPDYTEENQQRARRAESRSIARFQKYMSGKGGSGDDDEDEDGFSNGYIPYQSEFDGNESTVVNTPAMNSKNVKIPSARVSTTEAWDLSSGGQRENPKRVMKGDISRLADVPVHKRTGRVVQEDYANNFPGEIEWKKVAVLSTKSQSGVDKDYFVPASAIQENLTKSQKDIYKKFMGKKVPQRPTQSNQQLRIPQQYRGALD